MRCSPHALNPRVEMSTCCQMCRLVDRWNGRFCLCLNLGSAVQYKLHAQFLRLFSLHSDVNDAHRAVANRLQNKTQKFTYTSLEFGKVCEDLSWNHCVSTPHRSEKNGVKVWIDKHGETRLFLKYQKSCHRNQPQSQNQIKMRITNRYGETRIPTYRNGCKNSERILWMREFLNTETHTRVLLMNHL